MSADSHDPCAAPGPASGQRPGRRTLARAGGGACRIRRLPILPGQHAGCRHAEVLTASLQSVAAAGDRGYDSDKLRVHWRERRIGVCVTPKRNRLVRHAYNAAPCRTRHMVENPCDRLKDHRRLSLAARQGKHRPPRVCLVRRSTDKAAAKGQAMSSDPGRSDGHE